MTAVTLYHNPKCSTSRKALDALTDGGAEVQVVEYLKAPLDEQALRSIIDRLEDPVADLVRKDPYFKDQGFDAADYTEADAVIDLLVAHPRLLQRPLLAVGDRVFIGRPLDRVHELVD